MNQKKEIRKKFSGIRSKLSVDDVNKKSQLIEQRVLQSEEYKKANIIHCYVSISENNEVNTHEIIRKSLLNGKTVVVPKMAEDRSLKHYKINSFEDLTPNKWNIPEPDSGEEISETELDLILVPMLAGDRGKNRIGYGKGFYDLFLAQSNAVKAGLLFSCQLYQHKIPVEHFDVPLDIIFTELERID